uniref:HMG box domain-containing protein n=1 Tax=Glossina austeni TaxID=7395 RepID=A0A1A9ULA1_GLOAU
AITKILGDWWASLDANDKKYFTNLAQQNKDAFFSANPNFKWYKLPAPPLRTLNTRPTHIATNEEIVDTLDQNTIRSNVNYFKLADEAQMGELSSLLQEKHKSKQCALQQALGETTQFLTTHIPGNMEMVEEKQLKRRLYSENSFSSNSSEEDGVVPKKKSARSCKGKIYQELINSGQIAPLVKKSKSSVRLAETLLQDGSGKQSSLVREVDMDREALLGIGQSRSLSETENVLPCDIGNFDLEEKIKELPALSLDDYLQRKRNTKKKKKFSTNKTPLAITYNGSCEKDINMTDNKCADVTALNLASCPSPLNQRSVEILNNLNDNISSTSDLLILAEVAANRTELNH